MTQFGQVKNIVFEFNWALILKYLTEIVGCDFSNTITNVPT